MRWLSAGVLDVQTINKGQIAKKVLDDIRSIPPTKRLPWGSRQCRVNRNYGHRGGSSVFIAADPSGAGHSDEPFKPLNLTYSLFEELPSTSLGLVGSAWLPDFRRTRMSALPWEQTDPNSGDNVASAAFLPIFDSITDPRGDLGY